VGRQAPQVKLETIKFNYFLLGERVPVRVSLDEHGLRMGAEVPDREQGRLVIKNTYLSRLDLSLEVEEISEQQFNQRCIEILGIPPSSN